MREGDIYGWRYNDEEPNELGAYGRYHCKSQVAVVRNGRLVDTYWPDNSGTVLEEDAVKLTLKANLGDLIEISAYEALYYDSGDIVDLRHGNNSRGPVYRRKGSARCARAICERLDSKISEAKSDIRLANSRLEHYARQRAKIESGELDDVNFI